MTPYASSPRCAGLKVDFVKAGSREIATKFDLKKLGLIETELNTIQADLSKNDAQALIVHGEFLKRKLESAATDFLSAAE